MCASCKRVRTDDDWEPVEQYLERHGEVSVSHGLCQPCAGKLYPTSSTRVSTPAEPLNQAARVLSRRGARAVESGGLENRWACKRPVGSNPTPAAFLAGSLVVCVGRRGVMSPAATGRGRNAAGVPDGNRRLGGVHCAAGHGSGRKCCRAGQQSDRRGPRGGRAYRHPRHGRAGRDARVPQRLRRVHLHAAGRGVQRDAEHGCGGTGARVHAPGGAAERRLRRQRRKRPGDPRPLRLQRPLGR